MAKTLYPALKGKIALAYTAGICDGEGCIEIGKWKANRSKAGYRYELRVLVGNSKEWLLQWLKMQYGGSVYCQDFGSLRRQPEWKWQLAGKAAASFLELILPYLILKRAEAELALQFRAQVGLLTGKRKGLSDKMLAVREAQYILMQNLKRRKERACLEPLPPKD